MRNKPLKGLITKQSPLQHGTLEDFQSGKNGHNPDTMKGSHEDWHLDQSLKLKNKKKSKD